MVSTILLAILITLGVREADSHKDYAIAVSGSGNTFQAKIRFDRGNWFDMTEDDRAVLLNDIVLMVEERGGKEPYEITATDSRTKEVIFSHNSEEGLVEFGGKK